MPRLRSRTARCLLAACLAVSATLSAGAGLAQATGITVRVPVLMYHHIGQPIGPAGGNQFYVSQAAFDAQMGIYNWTSLSYFKSHLPAPAVSQARAIDLGAMLRAIWLGLGFSP